MNPTQAFSHAREFLLRRGSDYDAAIAEFRWARLPRFNWHIDCSTVTPAGTPAAQASARARRNVIRSS